ncbi:MmgE/PrpD family protein [Pseudomonas sp. nanlin1]|uniref:MmgE/PrpD family protein n=1 Tax=Pseudomonas sp. nanlin1 TaxID=3040605 RepID=UPI00389027D9
MSGLLELAGFVAESPFAAIPDAVVAKARRHLLDTLGAALAGADSAQAQRCLAALVGSEPAGRVGVWGSAQRLSARSAALVNGVAAHALELDDAGGCDHSGAVVVPALLAAVDLCAVPPTGEELLTAMVLGYDVARRVLEACGGYSPHNAVGWHSTGTCGVFGAAAGCARLLGLDRLQVANALGLAASLSGGLWSFIHDGADSKKLHAGRPAEAGLLAALLAREGMSGPLQVFEDRWGGFLRTYAGAAAVPQALTAELGCVWKLARCSIKPYAACRGTHSAIDAVGDLLDGLGADGRQVERIQVRASEFLLGMCAGTDTTTLAAAQMSLPYALAVRCLRGSAGLDSYEAPVRSAAQVQGFLARITMVLEPTLAPLDEPIVEVLLQDGRAASRQVKFALGGPLNPLSDAALVAKFRALAGRTLPIAQVEELLALCLGLDASIEAPALLRQLCRAP